MVAALLWPMAGGAQTNGPGFDAIYPRKMPAWFNEAKFGVFIVWGVYSVPGWAPKGQYAEWYGHNIGDAGSAAQKYHDRVWGKDFTYDQFVPRLTGEGFNADAWTALIQKAGAKYVVTAANYHDGFAMYPTKYSVSKFGDHWNAFDRGPHRDVLGELEAAGNARGLKMGIYYSLYEWWHPLYLSGQLERYAREHLAPKFKEVITRYQPPVIFLDGEWEHPYQTWHSDELAKWLYTESPVKDEVVVNDRWGSETRHRHGGYWTTEYTPGMSGMDHPWEESRGMGFSYGYNRAERLEDYHSGRELVIMLVDIVSRGGNLLLDIGPAADGTIPVVMQDRLYQIGDWLHVNGEAIYGSKQWKVTRQWSTGEVPTVKYNTEYETAYDVTKLVTKPEPGKAAIEAFFTTKGNAIYAILPRWPAHSFELKNVSGVKSVTLLGSPDTLKFKRAAGGVTIDLPLLPDELLHQPAWVLKVSR